jgi:hypothetical protein
MGPIWHKYYEECQSVLFVVDASSPDMMPTAAFQLHSLLQHRHLKVRVYVVSDKELFWTEIHHSLAQGHNQPGHQGGPVLVIPTPGGNTG